MEEGVIKFRLQFTEAAPVEMEPLAELNRWRTILWQRALIGQDPARYDGYDFGNVSQRSSDIDAPPDKRSFIISGTQTGHLPELDSRHYAVVISYNALNNAVIAAGPVKPSSESLTHGMLYDLDDAIRVVLHVHSPDIWGAANHLGIPATDRTAAYGTPGMAAEVQRLFSETAVREKKLFSMGGHEDGIVAFGETAEEAGDTLLRALEASLKH
jgi:ribulose-5-phosphate 4-epimerase/fuculose-1-phosphate aldolase